MKHLLNGVAIAAALAIAAPVWAAQKAPMTPSAGAPHAATHAAKPAKAKKATKAAARRHHRRPVRHPVARRHIRKGRHIVSGNRMTEQLNREELARIQAGNAAAAPAAPPPAPRTR